MISQPELVPSAAPATWEGCERGFCSSRASDSVRQRSVRAPRRRSRLLNASFRYQLPAAVLDRMRANVVCADGYFKELGSAGAARGQFLDSEHGREEHTLVFCQTGVVELDLDGRPLELTTRQAMLIPAHTAHTGRVRSARPAAVFWMCFGGDDHDYLVRNLGEGLTLITLDASGARTAMELFRQICELFERETTELSLIHGSHLARLLLSHLLCHPRTCLQADQQPRHPGVRSALDFMQSNIRMSVALQEIARQAGLSVSHLCCLFRSQMGITPMDYFIRLKLQKARRLLINSALTVQEIAQQVGYEDRYYFSRLFRKLHGMPPVAYRRLQRTPA